MLCRMCFAHGWAVHRGTKIGIGYQFSVGVYVVFVMCAAFVNFGTIIRLSDV